MAEEQKVEEQQKLSVRDQLQRDRLEKMRQNQAPRIRVLPRDDDIRKYIKHQPSLIAFPESGSVEWPDDAFTRRRIADGDVTVEEESTQQPDAPAKRSRGAASSS